MLYTGSFDHSQKENILRLLYQVSHCSLHCSELKSCEKLKVEKLSGNDKSYISHLMVNSTQQTTLRLCAENTYFQKSFADNSWGGHLKLIQVNGRIPELVAYMESSATPIEPMFNQMYDGMIWSSWTESETHYCGSTTWNGLLGFSVNCTYTQHITICEYGMYINCILHSKTFNI